MVVKFFKVPFANAGTKATVPDATQPDGSVNYSDGFGPDYALDPTSNPSAINIPRDQTNQILYDATSAIGEIQQQGFPSFNVAAYPYDINATVRWTDGKNYYSKITNNNTDPTNATNWGLVSYTTVTEPTGTGKDFWGNTLPAGYVWANGTTIGDVLSNATGFADPSTQALFTMLWTSFTNATLPIFTSAGAVSTRGVSAAADWVAHKQIQVPDTRGRTVVGLGVMGGSISPARITIGGCGINGDTLGAYGGEQTHQLTQAELASHSHAGGEFNQFNYIDGTMLAAVRRIDQLQVQTGNAGGDQPHNNTQPSIVANYIIKL